jgi:hypothetical protein
MNLESAFPCVKIWNLTMIAHATSFRIARICAAFLDTDAFIVYYIAERILLGNAIE